MIAQTIAGMTKLCATQIMYCVYVGFIVDHRDYFIFEMCIM